MKYINIILKNNTLDPALEMFHDVVMYYMYVLNMGNNQIHIGFTKDLKQRLAQHHSGKVLYTRKFLPVQLVYYECYLSRTDAKIREVNVKRYGSTYSHLKKRILESIKTSQGRG